MDNPKKKLHRFRITELRKRIVKIRGPCIKRPAKRAVIKII